MRVAFVTLVVALVLLGGTACLAGSVSGSYVDLAPGTEIDLTTTGTLDWIKFANGENQTNSFFVTTKIGNPVFQPATLAVSGDPDVDFFAVTGFGVLNFTWTDGNFGMYNGAGPVDSVVTETLDPPAASYPIGLGMNFDALADVGMRRMNVYVQGFNADVRITASMSGGGTSAVEVSPSHNPASDPNNNYVVGYYQIDYAGAGETLNVSIETIARVNGAPESAFANAGFFAATVVAVPEPGTFALAACGAAALGGIAARRRRARAA